MDPKRLQQFKTFTEQEICYGVNSMARFVMEKLHYDIAIDAVKLSDWNAYRTAAKILNLEPGETLRKKDRE